MRSSLLTLDDLMAADTWDLDTLGDLVDLLSEEALTSVSVSRSSDDGWSITVGHPRGGGQCWSCDDHDLRRLVDRVRARIARDLARHYAMLASMPEDF